jgi:hypothetical protein
MVSVSSEMAQANVIADINGTTEFRCFSIQLARSWLSRKDGGNCSMEMVRLGLIDYTT